MHANSFALEQFGVGPAQRVKRKLILAGKKRCASFDDGRANVC